MATTELVKRQLPSEVAYTDEANTFTENQSIQKDQAGVPTGITVTNMDADGQTYNSEDTVNSGVYRGSDATQKKSFEGSYSQSVWAERVVNGEDNVDDPGSVVYASSNHPSIFKVNGTERARINSSGMDVTGDFTVNGSPISGSGISKEEAIAYAIVFG